MTTENIHIGYVNTNSGDIYVQIPDDNRWGFAICDDDMSWSYHNTSGMPGEWTAIEDDDPRITDERREQLQWILDDAREGA